MPPDLNDEVAFISGVAADGRLELESFASWNNGTNPADYSGGLTSAYKWGGNTAGTTGGTVRYYFDPVSSWSPDEQTMLASGLALWSAIANISFISITNVSQAQITFTRGNDGKAITSHQLTGTGGAGVTGGTRLYTATSASISIDTSVSSFGPFTGNDRFARAGGNPIRTFLHEIGHAIGLGHAGPYDGAIDEATQQFSPYDSELWTIESYIGARDTSAKYYSQYPVAGTNWGVGAGGFFRVPTTWMPLDILAAQRLYGAPVATPLSGGQTFGFQCNIGGNLSQYFDFNINRAPVITLWSAGANNTLNISGWSTTSNVNLNPGTFSSCGGMINNIAIAFGTAIDIFVGGAGIDTVLCNDRGDIITLGGGNDAVTGGVGNDRFDGGSGNDTLDGGAGFDTAIFSSARTGYSIVRNADGSFQISGADGVDTLRRMESLSFTDQLLALGMVASDANGDGKGDVFWQHVNGQLAIWYLNGVARSADAVVSPNPGPSWHVRGTGDFNGDGKADVIWQNEDSRIAVWLMDGSSIVSDSVVGGGPGQAWRLIAAGDFNGDGKSDAVWQNTDDGNVAIWLLNGTSSVADGIVGSNPGAAWRAVGAGDFDGDGKSDILFRNDDGRIAVWLMNGLAFRLGQVSGNPGTAWNVRGIGDLSADGKSDIVLQNDNGQVQTWIMNGTAVSASNIASPNPGPAWQIMGMTDSDGDGRSDILFQNDDGRAVVWLMNGTTRTGDGELTPNPGRNWNIANFSQLPASQKSDFNGDGKSDLLWQNDDGQIALWEMYGSERIASEIVSSPGTAWHVKGNGDFDGDGGADILLQHDDGTVAVWLMNGMRRVSAATVGTNPGTSIHAVGTGDFNGDGKADILLQNDNGQAVIWLMDGATRLSAANVSPNPGAAWRAVTTGDFNGDGKSDIVWEKSDGENSIWLMDGSTMSGGATIREAGNLDWHVIATGDFNGDRKTDLLWQSVSGAGIWLMNGLARTSSNDPFGVWSASRNAGWSIRSAGDFNGDGLSDIGWQNTNTGEASVWLVNGLTRIGAAALTPNPGPAWHVIASG